MVMAELLFCALKCFKKGENSVQVLSSKGYCNFYFQRGLSSCFIQMKAMIAVAADIFVHQVTCLRVHVCVFYSQNRTSLEMPKIDPPLMSVFSIPSF